jgi:hypothetical protein
MTVDQRALKILDDMNAELTKRDLRDAMGKPIIFTVEHSNIIWILCLTFAKAIEDSK